MSAPIARPDMARMQMRLVDDFDMRRLETFTEPGLESLTHDSFPSGRVHHFPASQILAVLRPSMSDKYQISVRLGRFEGAIPIRARPTGIPGLEAGFEILMEVGG